MTAFGALVEYGRLKKEDTVLITAASSSVGLAAIQIVKSVGAMAVAATRGDSKKQFLLEAGADHVIVTDNEDVADKMKDITGGKGATVIFDPVAGPFLEKLAVPQRNVPLYFNTVLYRWPPHRFLCWKQSEKA